MPSFLDETLYFYFKVTNFTFVKFCCWILLLYFLLFNFSCNFFFHFLSIILFVFISHYSNIFLNSMHFKKIVTLKYQAASKFQMFFCSFLLLFIPIMWLNFCFTVIPDIWKKSGVPISKSESQVHACFCNIRLIPLTTDL